MEHNYAYPINADWSTAELETVIHFLAAVEDAYEVGTTAERVLATYAEFKKVMPAKSEEKAYGRDFARVSGYQLYDVVQAAKEQQTGKLKLN